MAETRQWGGPSARGRSSDDRGTESDRDGGSRGPGGRDRGGSGRAEPLGPPRRHDPRIDPPTKADRRRTGWWVAVLAFTPICLGLLVWATVNWNGSYPNVKAPVPHSWQAVPGIYASFSVPGNWSLQPFMSDAASDVYYSGPAGGIGESVTQADKEPSATGHLPAIVGTFLTERYSVASVTPFRLRNAAAAWRYQFRLANGIEGTGILAWASATQSEVWLIATPRTATTDEALSTLTLAP
jgi:hypothetical protein